MLQRFYTIARRAGIVDLPRAFDNCRASRSTELIRDFGAKAESQWLGHSTETALKHYKDFVMITEQGHAKAIGRQAAKTVNEIDSVLLSEVVERERLDIECHYFMDRRKDRTGFYCQNY
jgi:hypothetical protein